MHTYAEAAAKFPGESIKSACVGTSFQEKFDAELRIINDPNNPKYKEWFLPEDLKEFVPVRNQPQLGSLTAEEMSSGLLQVAVPAM